MDNLMSSMFNPESMKNLMENEEIKKMMSDPKLMGNLKNMMGGMGGMRGMGGMSPRIPPMGGGGMRGEDEPDECDDGADCCNADESYTVEHNNDCDLPCETGECDEIKIDDLENIEIDGNRLNVGDKILTRNLATESYNNRTGVIKDILPNGRCVILFDDNVDANVDANVDVNVDANVDRRSKTAAIKEVNLVNRYENIPNID